MGHSKYCFHRPHYGAPGGAPAAFPVEAMDHLGHNSYEAQTTFKVDLH